MRGQCPACQGVFSGDNSIGGFACPYCGSHAVEMGGDLLVGLDAADPDGFTDEAFFLDSEGGLDDLVM